MNNPEFVAGLKDGAECFQAAEPTLEEVIETIQYTFSPRAQAVERVSQLLGGAIPSDAYKTGFITSWLHCYAVSNGSVVV